jgi:E3 ubiquitin-protein ligase TRIP12
MIKNVPLFTNQGIRFLINHQLIKEDGSSKEEGFQDLDLQIGVSQLQPNLFHHHKLDSFILKNI